MTPAFCLLTAVLLTAVAMAAPTTGPTAESPLKNLRDRRRVLVIVAPDGDDTSLDKQRQIARADVGGFAERDLTVIEAVGGSGTLDGTPLPAASVAAMCRELRVDGKAFAVLLIGKDGGVKLREGMPVEAKQLYELIDSMPMRQREMKR